MLIYPQSGTKKSSHKSMLTSIFFFSLMTRLMGRLGKQGHRQHSIEVVGSLFSLWVPYVLSDCENIKFTTCLAVKALNALVPHLPFSLSPRYPSMLYLESCFTKFPVPSVTFVIVTATETCLFLPGIVPCPPRPTLYYGLSTHIKTANLEFISPFTGQLQAF